MDVREKLVELLEPHMSGLACEYESGSCELTSCRSCNARNIADHLIENGVTVQEDCKNCAEATQNCIVKLQEQIKELRSVQELDGCEYCKEDREGFIRMFGAFSITNPFHGNEWFINTGHCKPRQIFFCPMCGRKLPQPPKGEQP